MGDILVVNSKVKDYIKAEGCQTAGDVAEALSKYVQDALKTAVGRAKANGRKTVRGTDI